MSHNFIGKSRRKLGIDLDCVRVPFLTRDGTPSCYGRYTPSREERTKLRVFVIEQGGGLDE